MATKHRLAIIGYGGQGGWHADKTLAHDLIDLAGIYDIKPERCQLARDKGIFAYDSLEDVLADKSVDLITVATPNQFHKEIVIKALEAGKNVISEKPVTLSVSDLDEMIATSEKTGKLFTVHQNRRWDIDFLMTKAVYESGEIGEVYTIESRIHGSRGIPGDWRLTKEAGGGMVYDWGVHLIDQGLQIIKEKIVAVFARLDHITNQEVDDGCRIDIFFESGKVYSVEVGTCNFVQLPRFYMIGRGGTMSIPDWLSKAKIIKNKGWTINNVKPVVTAAGITKTMAPRLPEEIIEEDRELPKSDVYDFYRNVVGAIDGECEQAITHKEIRRVLQVIEAVFASAENNEVIKVNI